MSQSQALQTETETVMTKNEAEQLRLIMEKIDIANFFKDAWLCIDYPSHTSIVNRNHHEPHEGCTAHLLIADIIGKPAYRRAISRLISRSPSMLDLLEKTLMIIEEEAERREFVKPSPEYLANASEAERQYHSEMRELVNEIQAEIDKARGKGAQ